MKPWHWILFISVMVLATAGVIYGVLTHKEAGLMKVCWIAGRASFTEECSTKVDLKWDPKRIPLQVYLDLDNDHQVYRDSIVDAINLWNGELKLKRHAFMITDTAATSDVFVSWASKTGDKAASTQFIGGPDYPDRAEVHLAEASDVNAVFRFAVHEFGHVLGLAHDESTSSIMHPTAKGSDEGEEGMISATPSDADVRLLRELYDK